MEVITILSVETLRHFRLLHNLSQRELGNEMGVSRNYISMVESRERKLSDELQDRYVAAVYSASAKKQKSKEENVEEILKDVESIVKENKKGE